MHAHIYDLWEPSVWNAHSVGRHPKEDLDRLDIDRHDPEALARMRHTEEIAGRCSRDLAADDDTIAGDKDFLDVELHIWDRLGEAADDSDGVLTAPALARNIPPARPVARP